MDSCILQAHHVAESNCSGSRTTRHYIPDKRSINRRLVLNSTAHGCVRLAKTDPRDKGRRTLQPVVPISVRAKNSPTARNQFFVRLEDPERSRRPAQHQQTRITAAHTCAPRLGDGAVSSTHPNSTAPPTHGTALLYIRNTGRRDGGDRKTPPEPVFRKKTVTGIACRHHALRKSMLVRICTPKHMLQTQPASCRYLAGAPVGSDSHGRFTGCGSRRRLF